MPEVHIARNEARRSLGNERPVSLEDLGHAGINDLAGSELVIDGLEKQDDRIRLQNALNLVPAKFRRALEARFVEGLSGLKIAERERVPYGTVLSRIHKGKQLLREAGRFNGRRRRPICPLLAPRASQRRTTPSTCGSPDSSWAPRTSSGHNLGSVESGGCNRVRSTTSKPYVPFNSIDDLEHGSANAARRNARRSRRQSGRTGL